jgi:hypothetical protein
VRALFGVKKIHTVEILEESIPKEFFLQSFFLVCSLKTIGLCIQFRRKIFLGPHLMEISLVSVTIMACTYFFSHNFLCFSCDTIKQPPIQILVFPFHVGFFMTCHCQSYVFPILAFF